MTTIVSKKKKPTVPNAIDEDHKGVKINTPIFRLSYPQLTEPRAYKPGQKKFFSIEMLFTQGSKEFKAFEKEILKCATDAFGKDQDEWPEEINWPMFDGDEKQDSIGYKGMIYFRAKTEESKRPMLFKRDKTVATDSEFYGGCFCDAVVTAKAVYVDGNHFVSLYLNALRFVKPGTAFGAGVSAEDFGDLPDEEEDDTEADDGEKFW